MDWKPNIEGINWFIEEVWPSLVEEYNDIEFHLAGRNMPSEYETSERKNLYIRGEVNDAISFLDDLDIVVVPLFSGSGIRIKILESLALGKPVLSTLKGFEGIDVKHGKDAFLFESKEELIRAVKEILNDLDMTQIAKNARDLVVNNFGYKQINANILACLSNLYNS